MSIEALEAQIAALRADEALVQAKADHAAGNLTGDELRAVKAAAREARRAYRADHRNSLPVDGVAVTPDAVNVTVEP